MMIAVTCLECGLEFPMNSLDDAIPEHDCGNPEFDGECLENDLPEVEIPHPLGCLECKAFMEGNNGFCANPECWRTIGLERSLARQEK